MKTVTDEMVIVGAIDFFVWAKKTHPEVVANLASEYKKFRKQLKDEVVAGIILQEEEE